MAKQSSNWGGSRAGAGAPKGNTNALKHGRYSRRFAHLMRKVRMELTRADELIETVVEIATGGSSIPRQRKRLERGPQRTGMNTSQMSGRQ